MFELKSMLSLHAGDRALGGLNRIALLEKIGEDRFDLFRRLCGGHEL